MGEINYGISGVETFTAQNVVVGPGGSIVNYGDALVHLERLRGAVETYAGDPATKQRIVAATEDVSAELAAPQPDRHKLLDRLATIRDAVGSAGAIATAATTLVSFLAPIL
jgi:hypothetical protein